MYIYKVKSDNTYEVGRFNRDKIWIPESNHQTAGTAARRVSWLNKVKCKMQPIKHPCSNQMEFLFTDEPTTPTERKTTMVSDLAQPNLGLPRPR